MKRIKYTTYFDIENFNITNGALEHFKQNKIDMIDVLILIEKHKFNEDENPSEEDLQANVNALHNGGMFLSVYNVANEKVYIISYIDPKETKSLETTVLLSSEY